MPATNAKRSKKAVKDSSVENFPKGWYERGYLPHYDGGSITQFITCRLFDSLPQSVLDNFRLEVERSRPENVNREVMKLIEKYLDAGHGECSLKSREVCGVVKSALQKFDGERYKLISWVIMPNHIHLLLRPLESWTLPSIIHSFKSFTALEANKVLNRRGEFWMREYFDRFIRDYEHFEKTIRYIENNPVKAGFCERASEWEFGSAYAKPL